MVTLCGFDLVNAYTTLCTFFDEKRPNIIYVDIFNQRFQIIFVEKAFSNESESFTFFENEIKSAGYLTADVRVWV